MDKGHKEREEDPLAGKISGSPGRVFIPWLIFGMVFLTLGGSIGLSLFRENRRIDAQERERLATQAKVIGASLGHHLCSVNQALGDIRRELPLWNARKDGMALAKRSLQALNDAMPEVLTCFILDSEGTVLVESRAGVVGRNTADPGSLRSLRKHHDPAMLYFSPPIETATGGLAVNAMRTIAGPNGQFAGIVAATVDTRNFSTLLESVLYAPDMWGVLAMGDGKEFLLRQEHDGASGMDFARIGSILARHRETGKVGTEVAGTAYSAGEEWLISRLTVKHANVLPGKPIIVAVGRDRGAVYAAWRQDLVVQCGLFGTLALAVAFILRFHQRRQRDCDRLVGSYVRELRESETRCRAISDNAPAVIFVKDMAGRYIHVNRQWEEIFHLSKAAIQGKTSRDIFRRELADAFEKDEQRVVRTGEPISVEEQASHDDGIHTYLVVMFPLLNTARETYAVCGIATDITERKRFEEELKQSREQLRELSSHIVSVVEDERRRIARKVHDVLGQGVLALKMDISRFAEELGPGQARARSWTRTLQKEVTSILKTMQQISTELRPVILDDLGLGAAIEWLAGDFGERTGIACRVAQVPGDMGIQDGRISTALFRIAQELLSNVGRHARATSVDIRMEKTSRDLTLTIRDDGVGIPDACLTDSWAFGLVGMRERAMSCGGEIDFRKGSGGGTTAVVRIPLTEKEEAG